MLAAYVEASNDTSILSRALPLAEVSVCGFDIFQDVKFTHYLFTLNRKSSLGGQRTVLSPSPALSQMPLIPCIVMLSTILLPVPNLI